MIQTVSVIALISLMTVSLSAYEDRPELKVDPLLLAQAEEVWSIIAAKENPIWPGWNASDTPLLFYFPHVQDVLINHPKPPEGFHRYTGPVTMAGSPVYVRNKKTFLELDGQNTATLIAGVPTLVVADTLSNRRNNILGMIDSARNSKNSAEPTWEQLFEDPYGKICMIAHEAFHVFQQRQGTGKAQSEEELTRYPTISAANALGFALEGEVLSEAIRKRNTSEFRDAAMRWLAMRLHRREKLSTGAIKYEDHIEYLEGLAKYVEYRLLEVLETKTPRPAMHLLQGFKGYANLAAERETLVRQMVKLMRGEVNVNNDPYGASSLRMRLYYSGMGVAILLDELNADWKQQIFAPERTLTELVVSALKPTQTDLKAALAKVQSRVDYPILAASKAQFEKDGAAAIKKTVEEIETGEKTTLVLDYSALSDVKPGFAYTPFGVLRVDENRTIYRLVPISVRLGGVTLRQQMPTPLIHDRAAKRIICQLQEVVTASTINPIRQNQVVETDLKLPGVTISMCKLEVSIEQRKLVVRLVP